MMKRLLTITVGIITATFLMASPIKACDAGEVDFVGQGFQTIKVTAYCCGTKTSLGVPVQCGIMATSPEHHGEVAELWLPGGGFLGYYYCCDSGGTDAIRQGYVVDVYRVNLTQCKSLMKLVSGKKCYIKYHKGEG